ncbi:MAG: fructosamine kinase family protein [Bacteroidetes bacterium]|nr:fructosamine kinase family protein [Bacteroidota bacterium]
MNSILKKIALKQNLKLENAKSLQGGDINEVFLLECGSEKYVIKINEASKYPNMFEAEALGLKLLQVTNSFKIPKIIAAGVEGKTSYLLLEYISTGSTYQVFWKDFAYCLVKLHQTTQNNFGLKHNNYIGSLQQINNIESSASDFYINQRLIPQFKIADELDFKFSSLERFFKNISEEIPDEAPSLIHGDLWNGNYMVSNKGEPTLIDPAVAYAPREMDIAMMHLFGGFPQDVYSIYNEQFPLIENWKDRISLWQLYYLLVHLNLFGSSYLSQVKGIIKQYS